MIGETIYEIVENLVKTHETRNPFKLCRELDIILLFVPLVRVNGFYQRYEGQDIIYINEPYGHVFHNLTKLITTTIWINH